MKQKQYVALKEEENEEKNLIHQHSNHFESPSKHLHLHPRQSKTSSCVKLSNQYCVDDSDYYSGDEKLRFHLKTCLWKENKVNKFKTKI